MTDHESSNSQNADQTKYDSQTCNSYQTYYNSGYYDQRYPTPNRSMWRRIKKHLKPAASVLDYGCGSGRYLFALRENVTRAIGFDVSPAALALVRERAAAIAWETVTAVGPATDDLDSHLTSYGQVDLVLCLFGVLAHITDPTERAAALRRMHGALKSDTGHLLISVPNIARRFRNEQKKGVVDGLVSYSRHVDDVPMYLNYQLFDPSRFLSELRTAGFKVHSLKAEGVLPESWLLHSFTARCLDRLLTPMCPTAWGYGLVAEASP